MREYRGRTKDGKWVKGWLVRLLDGDFIIVKEAARTGPLHPMYPGAALGGYYFVIPETVGQSTGLFDKTKWENATEEQRRGYTKETWNGVEIFEGDIVKQTYEFEMPGSEYQESYSDGGYYIGEVRLLPSTGVVMVKPRKISTYDDNTFQLNHSKNVRTYRAEVIGNIHDNPELLKDDETGEPK